MAAYHLGQSVKLTVAFTDADGASADPTAVVCKVQTPSGTTTTYTYGTDAALTKTATGAYQLIVAASESGLWVYRWEGTTGALTPRDEEQFHVLRSAF